MEELATSPGDMWRHVLIMPVAQMRKREPRGSRGHTHAPQHSCAPPCVTPRRPASLTSPSRAATSGSPFRLPHLDADPDWDAEHGGQGHEPAVCQPQAG